MNSLVIKTVHRMLVASLIYIFVYIPVKCSFRKWRGIRLNNNYNEAGYFYSKVIRDYYYRECMSNQFWRVMNAFLFIAFLTYISDKLENKDKKKIRNTLFNIARLMIFIIGFFIIQKVGKKYFNYKHNSLYN